MQNYQKKHLFTLYMVFFLSFILEFIDLFITLFRSFSLTNINIPFIETSTILKRFFVFFASFFIRNITYFIFHFIKLSQQKRRKHSPFGQQQHSFFHLSPHPFCISSSATSLLLNNPFLATPPLFLPLNA